jgi:hypothetical protein
MFRGARKGRTVLTLLSSALHFTVWGGQTGRGQGAGGGQTVGAGHFTSGQRGGGHSPASFLQAELSMITGCCLGMLLLSTYLLRSGTGGHSVFSIYRDISGQAGQGGIVLFNTYLLMSGSRQGGQIKRAIPLGVHPQLSWPLRQREQIGTPTNPSFVWNPSRLRPPTYFPNPKPTPRINTASASKSCGVTLTGTTEAIFLF